MTGRPRGPSRVRSAARPARSGSARDSTSSRNATISGFGFGTSTPTAPFPGIGATMRMLCARIASARSFDRFAICRTFTPAAGATSNCVTTGPVVRPTSSPSTRNVRKASISFTPIASSSRLPTSALRGGGGVSKSDDGRSSSVKSSASGSFASIQRRPSRRGVPLATPSFCSLFRSIEKHRIFGDRDIVHQRKVDRVGIPSGHRLEEVAATVAFLSATMISFAGSSPAFSAGVGAVPSRLDDAPADNHANRISKESVAAMSALRLIATRTHAPAALPRTGGCRTPQRIPRSPAERGRFPAIRPGRGRRSQAGETTMPRRKTMYDLSLALAEARRVAESARREREGEKSVAAGQPKNSAIAG